MDGARPDPSGPDSSRPDDPGPLTDAPYPGGLSGPSRRRPQIGRIESFDAERGMGTLLDSTGARVPFHCTAIADGTRTIDVGVAVRYLLAAGNLGRLEARGIVPIGPPAGGDAA